MTQMKQVEDAEVARYLRSDTPLVVVEAPAGCGKTHQGSQYAVDASRAGRGRVLVLTHTHAAANEFIARAENAAAAVDVRTLDSLVVEIADAYHAYLGLPDDVGKWAARRPDGFAEVAQRVAQLLDAAVGPGRALARRYPVVVFDEHQDTSDAQSALLNAVLRVGARVRVFGDPMQIIYPEADVETEWTRWRELCARADRRTVLKTPHRWATKNPQLGEWILDAREALGRGHPINLTGVLPAGLEVHRADNVGARWNDYRTTAEDGRPIRALARSDDVLFLTARNDTVQALRPYFFRQVSVWEGYTREALGTLAREVNEAQNDPRRIAHAFVRFVQAVAVGFSPSAFSERLLNEVGEGCSRSRRGKPALIQELGRCILRNPTHGGVADALRLLWTLSTSEPSFGQVKIDNVREYWDAVRLADSEDPEDGVANILQRRAWSRTVIPSRALSTIHKAKGLERDCVVVMPCDASHFPDNLKARCMLYVALSRARKRLVLVVPRTQVSPLLRID